MLCPPLPMTPTFSPYTLHLSWQHRTIGAHRGHTWARETGEGTDIETNPQVEPDPPDPGPQQTSPLFIPFADLIQNQRPPPSLPAWSVSAGNPTRSAPARPPFSGTASTNPGALAPLTVVLLMPPDDPYATTGTKSWVAKTNPPGTSMSALVVVMHHMECKTAISWRRHHPLTPLIAECWS